MKKIGWALLLAILTTGGVKSFAYAQTATAQADNGSIINLASLTCREMLQMPGAEEENTLIFMHGFMSGKNNELLLDVPALSDVTEQVRNYCIDNPDETLLSAFERHR